MKKIKSIKNNKNNKNYVSNNKKNKNKMSSNNIINNMNSKINNNMNNNMNYNMSNNMNNNMNNRMNNTNNSMINSMNNNMNNNINNNDYYKAKIIVLNDSDKIRKKSSSCRINIYNYDVTYNLRYRPRQIANILNNAQKLNLEENINKVKLVNGVKEINNYYYNHSPLNQYEDMNKMKMENKNLYKQYPHNNININNNFFPNISYNPNFIKNSGDQYLIRTKNLFTVTKLNSNLELEPQDNNRLTSTNKYYINSGTKPNIYKDYNKVNTIIINNNIHINNFID